MMLSTHLDRERKADDPLELILEPWGVWRQWGVSGLSSPNKSPMEGLNQLSREETDAIDRQRKTEIKLALIDLGYEGIDLIEQTKKEFRELQYRINSLNIPKETRSGKAKSPNYGGHKYYSKIDRILSGIHGPYYNILIHKYENLWEINTFVAEYGINYNLAKRRLYKARQAARRELTKNGYKA